MVESIPKHLLEKVAILYATKGTNEFSFQEAEEILGLTTSYTGQVLPNLVKAGWIKKKTDSNDGRRRFYRIVAPEKTLKELGDTKKLF